MKKGLLIGCGIASILGVALCIGIGFLVYGVFKLTQPVVDASDEFLGLLGQGKIAEAYASTADTFRAQQDEESFTAGVKQLGLTDYASASWRQRNINNQVGLVEGTVTTKSGVSAPVSIQLVHEGDKWKVVGVRSGGVELVTIKAPVAVPAEAELQSMATEALLDFNEAVKARDFDSFYEKLSDLWKKQTTSQQLGTIFQEYSDKEVDIGGIRDITPTFDPPPAVNESGVLVVAGHYPTEPSRVRFKLDYIHEPAGWKLVGIQVNVGKD